MSNKTVVRSLLIISFIFLRGLSFSESDYPKPISLTSLTDHCKLEVRWFGLWQVQREAVLLICGTSDFLVVHPNNLVGHVKIATQEQALEYVRLFSGSDTYGCFYLDGMVEMLPGVKQSAADFNVIDERKFLKYFTKVKVEERPASRSEAREFIIERTVVYLNQTICRITEKVREDGFYQIISEKLLYKNASKLGIIHYGIS